MKNDYDIDRKSDCRQTFVSWAFGSQTCGGRKPPVVRITNRALRRQQSPHGATGAASYGQICGRNAGAPLTRVLLERNATQMQPLEFSSILPEEFRPDLETLLFFNPLQKRARTGILQCVERYGQPRVHAENGLLRVAVGELPDVQTLYALAADGDSHELAGVAVYTREGDRLTILHLSVAESAAAAVGNGDGLLALRLAAAIREVGRSVQGIRRVILPYGVRFQQHLSPGTIESRQRSSQDRDKMHGS
jgi:hypothetical protein